MSEEIKADAFEAALAASASEIATPVVEVVEEIVAEVVSSTEPELALASDEDGDIESDENDPNAEFRRTLRTALGDWYGGLVNLEDQWRSVDDKGVGEVDVLFSYFMAFNREAMTQVGGFNPRAVYYRNADIEFSLKIRQAGGKLLQMDLPLTQGRHHGYHDADPDYRDAQSKKTFDRILEKYRGKEAILSPRR